MGGGKIIKKIYFASCIYAKKVVPLQRKLMEIYLTTLKLY